MSSSWRDIMFMQDDAKTTIWKLIVAVLEKIVKLEDLEEVTRLAEEAKGRKWKEHSSDLVSKLALCRIMLLFRHEYQKKRNVSIKLF